MKIGDRYILVLCVVAAVIVVPGGMARAFGASIGLLASIAAIQLFATIAFFLTSVASLALGIRTAIDKKWRAAVAYFGAMAIPFGAWSLAAFTNYPGWQAVMGI